MIINLIVAITILLLVAALLSPRPRPGQGMPWQGNISYVAYWDRPLSQKEIASLGEGLVNTKLRVLRPPTNPAGIDTVTYLERQ